MNRPVPTSIGAVITFGARCRRRRNKFVQTVAENFHPFLTGVLIAHRRRHGVAHENQQLGQRGPSLRSVLAARQAVLVAKSRQLGQRECP